MISSLPHPLLAAITATLLATAVVRHETGETIAATFGLHALAATIATAAVAFLGGTLDAGLYVGAFATLCVAVARVDAHTLIIPDALVLGLSAIALIAPFRPTLAEQAFGAVVMGAVFVGVRQWHFAARSREGLGLGDVKLAIVIGAALGANMALLAAGIAAAGMALWMVLRGAVQGNLHDDATQAVAPFGVGLAGALGVAVAAVAITQ